MMKDGQTPHESLTPKEHRLVAKALSHPRGETLAVGRERQYNTCF